MNNLLLIILTCLCLTDSIAQKNVKAADSLVLETEKFMKTIDTFQLNFHYHSIGSTFQCVKAKMDDGLIFKYRVHYRWSGVKKEKYVVKRRFSGKMYKGWLGLRLSTSPNENVACAFFLGVESI